MTDEERLALAEKLDKELDDYINALEPKPYKDGWDPANWREVSDFKFILSFDNVS